MSSSGIDSEQYSSGSTDEPFTGGMPNEWDVRERHLLAPYAMFSKDSRGRKHTEEPHSYRSPYQRDRDRVLHSAAFRRLSGKMQVFTGDMGDYHRTRLTHTHEVANIARTMGRTLRLNEDLIEALALLHDIGHPPYGHSGEDALADCLRPEGGFSHNAFALVLVEQLEMRYTRFPGLNLTREVLAGQDFRITHAGHTPILEVQIVDMADSIAYNAHDVDDALTLGLLDLEQLASLDLVRRAQERAQEKGQSNGLSTTRIGIHQALVNSLVDVQVADLISTSREVLDEVHDFDSLGVQQIGIQLGLSPTIAREREQLARFLFDNVYRHEKLLKVRNLAASRVTQIFDRLTSDPKRLPQRFVERARVVGERMAAGEFIGGMTDRFCDQTFVDLVENEAQQARDWHRR